LKVCFGAGNRERLGFGREIRAGERKAQETKKPTHRRGPATAGGHRATREQPQGSLRYLKQNQLAAKISGVGIRDIVFFRFMDVPVRLFAYLCLSDRDIYSTYLDRNVPKK
jgi:hypothetical protein